MRQDSIQPVFHLTSAGMTDDHEEHGSADKIRGMGWGIPASILLHAVFAFILFFHLPLDVAEPQKEESVSVEIVPPPEEPEQKAEEQKKPEEPKAEEAKKEAPPPPEPEKKEEAKKEEAKKEEPPPPPPEPPKEEAKKPEPPPPPPKQEEAKQEQEQKPEEEQGKGQPIPVLRPVFQFGEKDAGPRKSETGNAAEEAANPPEQTEPDAAQTEQIKPVEEKQETVTEAAPGTPLPNDVNAPEVDIASVNPQQNGPSNGAVPDATRLEIVTSPPPAAAATADPSKPPAPNKAPELKEAKTLFSRQATNDPTATTAMGNLPRGVRAGELCSTELREQLRNASYWPELLPSPRLPAGTVLDLRNLGFRARGQWYDVSFRCEIDEGATKVMSFAFNVGGVVPRSEWRKRGFPEF